MKTRHLLSDGALVGRTKTIKALLEFACFAVNQFSGRKCAGGVVGGGTTYTAAIV